MAAKLNRRPVKRRSASGLDGIDRQIERWALCVIGKPNGRKPIPLSANSFDALSVLNLEFDCGCRHPELSSDSVHVAAVALH